ncbi:MAG: cytochrome P450 [Cellvibrionales bacterium]|nr:cytochrome P450 [Cellvibrionales bacterium]
MNTAAINQIPLDQLDVSDPKLYAQDSWRPYFARLRKEAPVNRVSDSPYGPYWSVSTHGLIKEVDSNHRIFSSAMTWGGVTLERDIDLSYENFIAMDPPRHNTQRAAAAPAVGPQNLAKLESLIRQRAASILDSLPIGEEFNWVEQVSIELTCRMLATLLDFPYEDRHKLTYWTEVANSPPEFVGEGGMSYEERQTAMQDCADTFIKMWNERAAAPPGNDFISMLAHSGETAKDIFSDPKMMLGNVLLLIVGGNDTTRNSISGGVLALNESPDEYQKLRDNPAVIPNMVAEMIRWQTPVIYMRRTAVADTELGGKKIAKGDKVVMWYLSGNRDESVFPNADKLIVDRKNARNHVAFGFGIHRCMGNRLAEMQLRVLWEEIMPRFERIEVVGPVQRATNNVMRTITHVPVVLHPKK